MNTISSYLQNITSIDFKKEIKETILPSAASLATGALVNYNNPTAFAVSYIARQSFVKPWIFCLHLADTELTKKMNQIFPSYESKSALTKNIALVALGLAAPFAVGYKASEYAGYEMSLLGCLVGSCVGGIAHVIVQRKLQEDPFKGVDILTINKDNFQKEVLESNLPVVVDAYATWCPPCRAMTPIFSELSKELSGAVKFVKFNVDDNQELAQQLNIQGVPTFVFFKNGKPIEAHSGGLPKDQFATKIATSFK